MGAAPSKSADGEAIETASDAATAGTDHQVISELAALPLYFLASQINRMHFDAVLSGCAMRAPKWPAQRGIIAPQRRLTVVSRGQMHTTLIQRMISSQSTIAVKRVVSFACRISSQCHRIGPSSAPAGCGVTLKGHGDWVASVAFHPSGRYIATGSHDKTVKLWRLNERCSAAQCTSTLEVSNKRVYALTSGNAVAFHPSAPYLAVGNAEGASLWRIKKECNGAKLQLRCTTAPPEWVVGVAFHPAAPCLATASTDGASIWRISEDFTGAQRLCKLQMEETAHCASYSVAFHPSQPFLATGGYGNCLLWQLTQDCAAPTFVLQLQGHCRFSPIHCVAFHPSALVVATGSGDGTTKLWQFKSDCSRSNCVMTFEGQGGPVYSVAFHPSAAILATSNGNGSVMLWLLPLGGCTASLAATLQGLGGPVRSVAFHPSAICLVTGSDFGGVKLWQ